jgi:hypothetical protein
LVLSQLAQNPVGLLCKIAEGTENAQLSVRIDANKVYINNTKPGFGLGFTWGDAKLMNRYTVSENTDKKYQFTTENAFGAKTELPLNDVHSVTKRNFEGITTVLYAKEEHVNSMQPYQGGGGIISTVTFDKTTYVQGPLKFEAGTPNIEGAIGLAAAFDYCNKIGMKSIFEHETMLLKYANELFNNFPHVKIIGTTEHKAGVISFALENIHPFDIGTLLDKFGIAVRTGHHCTQPLMNFFNIPGTTRMSFGIYNTTQEIDYFFQALEKVLRMLS